MLTKYRNNGNPGRSVRFNSGVGGRDHGSHLRYSTDSIDRDFSLQKYSSGLDNYSKNKMYSDAGKYNNTYDDMTYRKTGYGVPSYNGYTGSDVGSKYDNYLDLSYRKLPPSNMYGSRPGNYGQLEPRLAKGILKKNEAFLRRHLVLSRSVLDKMVHCGLIGDVMKRRILHMDAMLQVAEIIRLLDDRGLGTLNKFIKVLRSTGSGWIADVLADTDAVEYEDLMQQRDERFDPRDHYENRLVKYNHGALKRYDSADDLMTLNRNRNYGGYSARAPSPDTLRRSSRVPLSHLLDSKHGGGGYSDVRGSIRPGFFLSNSTGGVLADQRGVGEEVPRIINNLESHFHHQTDNNEVALSTLKQEEMAIKELMDQNRREQQKVRKNQYTLMDINTKLRDVNVRATEVNDPVENAAVSTYRLNQLNQIPWAGKRY